MRGAWIEILAIAIDGEPLQSLPVRGAWIEIPLSGLELSKLSVAPCEGSVD